MATREEIIKIANGLYQEALNANSYYKIMLQYHDYYKLYKDELQISPAFYSITYLAMKNALCFELSKLYDRSKGAVNLGHLIKLCQENKCFPEYRELNGERKIPYLHKIQEREKWYFKDDIGQSNHCAELTASEYLDFLGKQYSSLRSITEHLIIQRNKIYAHNDGALSLNDEEILKRYPLYNADLKVLIDNAFDTTRFIIGALTGVEKATSYININDWKGTLDYVRIGMKYLDVEIKERTKLGKEGE